jgi:hypothetical protein
MQFTVAIDTISVVSTSADWLIKWTIALGNSFGFQRDLTIRPPVRITHILLEVDEAIGFTDAFSHLRNGAPCSDRVGLLIGLLAEGLNLGLRKMAEASNTSMTTGITSHAGSSRSPNATSPPTGISARV